MVPYPGVLSSTEVRVCEGWFSSLNTILWPSRHTGIKVVPLILLSTKRIEPLPASNWAATSGYVCKAGRQRSIALAMERALATSGAFGDIESRYSHPLV